MVSWLIDQGVGYEAQHTRGDGRLEPEASSRGPAGVCLPTGAAGAVQLEGYAGLRTCPGQLEVFRLRFEFLRAMAGASGSGPSPPPPRTDAGDLATILVSEVVEAYLVGLDVGSAAGRPAGAGARTSRFPNWRSKAGLEQVECRGRVHS